MRSDRRRLLSGIAALALATALPAQAEEGLEEVRQKGRLRVAVYNDFAPYSFDGRGIDVDLGHALAERLGVKAEIAWFNADEDMNDDLRNMVWRGHYLGGKPGDVMLHVPFDRHLATRNPQVRIVGPYHQERLAIARVPDRVPEPVGAAEEALGVFTREKIGVETASGPDAFLLGVLGGRLRENVVHFRGVPQAVEGLRGGKVAAVMAPRAELESALGKDVATFPVAPVQLPELRNTGSWPLALAVRSEAATLAEALAQAMQSLHDDGTVARIFARYGITHSVPKGS